jgi:hypothetical protein
MSDLLNFYFRQRVTEAELDLAFELLEKADRNLAADLGVFGVVSGAVPAPHSPVADLSIDLTAPARAYDHLGQRIYFGTGQTVNCAVDHSGIPTDVVSAGNERWLGIFLRFRRQLSDPRTDGNSQQVYFRRDESFEIVVRQDAQAPIGTAPKPALVDSELLICDVRRRAGQTQIVASDIDTSRRQAFIFAQAGAVAANSALWSVLQPAGATVQSALDEADAELQAHFSAADRRHAAAAIDVNPHGFVTATNLQSAVDELVDALSSTTSDQSGSRRIGAELIMGSPSTLGPGTVRSQIGTLLMMLNSHQTSSPAHQASAIGVTDATGRLNASNLLSALTEIVSAFEGNHFRGNETTPGYHRAILQPSLGSGRVLVWDAVGNGSNGSHMRAYLGDDGLTIVFNAAWVDPTWQKQSTSLPARGIRIGSNGLELLFESSAGFSFTAWTRTLRLSMSASTTTIAIEATGALTATGRCGTRVRNGEAAARSVGSGHGVTFAYRLPAAPSTISFTALSYSTPYPTVTAESITADGFCFSMNADVAASGTAYWFGNYTAYA